MGHKWHNTCTCHTHFLCRELEQNSVGAGPWHDTCLHLLWVCQKGQAENKCWLSLTFPKAPLVNSHEERLYEARQESQHFLLLKRPEQDVQRKREILKFLCNGLFSGWQRTFTILTEMLNTSKTKASFLTWYEVIPPGLPKTVKGIWRHYLGVTELWTRDGLALGTAPFFSWS